MVPTNNSFSKPVRVLLVENHQLLLWALCKLINGHRPAMEVVAVASTQADALERIPTAMPDLVLMKFELTMLGKQDMLPEELTSGCRTLLMVDDASAENLARVVRCGAHGALTRRSNADEVIKAIERTYAGELWFGRETANLALSALRSSGKQETAKRDTSLEKLTPRERKVLHAVIGSRSCPNKSLAKQLFISESTLRNHLSSIYQKLGVSNRLDLYMYAQNSGYTPASARELA